MSDRKLNIILKADNAQKRVDGLMFHKPLSKNECAFFIFPTAGQHRFWNANVDFPISLMFCDEKGTVKDIQYLEPFQTDSVGPKSYDIKFVVEAHKEVPESFKIKNGTKLLFREREIIFVD